MTAGQGKENMECVLQCQVLGVTKKFYVPKEDIDVDKKGKSGLEMLNILDMHMCAECKQPVLLDSHFRRRRKCRLCRYGTFCGSAFSGHISRFHNGAFKSRNKAHAQLVDQIYCNCGFTTRAGNSMAQHLLQCTKMSCTVKLSAPKLIRNTRDPIARGTLQQAPDTDFPDVTEIKKEPSEENFPSFETHGSITPETFQDETTAATTHLTSFEENIQTDGLENTEMFDDDLYHVINHEDIYILSESTPVRHSEEEGSSWTVVIDTNKYRRSFGTGMYLDMDTETNMSPDKSKLPSGSTASHQIGLNVQDWYCSACNSDFQNKSHFLSHMRIHNRDDSGLTPHSCSLCNAKFTTRLCLKKHMKLHTNEQPHLCRYCGAQFRLNSVLKAHENEHMGIKPHVCPICNARFTQACSLNVHQSVHTGEKPYACPYCDSTFRLKFHLTNHERTHTGERPYSCSLCGARFRTLTHVYNHKRTHSIERPFVCKTCGASFKRKDKLSRHVQRHSGIKPFKCCICDAKFASKYSLNKHEKRHTMGFKCKPCDIEFSKPEELAIHRKTHEPFKCEFCEMKFRTRGKLSFHRTGHTGEKPFTCDVCNSVFRTKSVLSSHLKVHTWEKPYSCPYCDATFRHRRNRHRHIQRHGRKGN